MSLVGSMLRRRRVFDPKQTLGSRYLGEKPGLGRDLCPPMERRERYVGKCPTADVGSISNQPPAIRAAPTARDTRCPLTIFSTSTSIAIAAIQNTSITPPTNNNVVNIQQHPTQRVPCQTPSFKAP